ncbi:MAG: deoxynucleoside kinase [Oscillospiraceae bacterium]
MNGRLIVIEGLDGSGKSTQVELLKKRLNDNNIDVKQIKLPDYDDKSSTLVKMYLNGEFGSDPSCVNIYAASSFYAVDRYASFQRHWKNDYLLGTLILADRYVTSNAVHQTVKLDKSKWGEYLTWLEDYEYNKMGIPKPNAVIFLDMPVEISQKLMSIRYNGDEVKKDVHEANVDYLIKCHEAAMFAADRLNWTVIECSDGENPLSIEAINDKIFEEVLKSI